jgi:hypothetical protein
MGETSGVVIAHDVQSDLERKESSNQVRVADGAADGGGDDG